MTAYYAAMTRPALIALTLGLCACSPASIHGTIDGDPVQRARSAFFDTIDLDFGVLGSLEYTIIVVTNVPEGCDVMEEMYSTVELTCDGLCDAYIDTYEDFNMHKDEYYTLWMTLNTGDGDEGEFDFDDDLGEEEFTADYSSWDARPLQDAGECEDECEDGDLLDADVEDGDDGLLEIKSADSDTVVGRFDIEFGGSEELKGSFKASECDMEEWSIFF